MAYQSKHRKSPETQLKIDGVSLEGLSLREFDKVVFEHYGAVCGIDEAGRGPIAGDVFAAAVVLDPNNPIEGLNDSKKLTPKKREALYEEIWDKALAASVSRALVEEIDETDILSADLLAMARAFEGVVVEPKIVLVDGDVLPELNEPFNENNVRFGGVLKNVIGGDAKSEAIAAASILAKVERDRYMCEMAEKYSSYGFEKHKGYGTKAHYEAIDKYGLCPIHRRSFLKKYLANKKDGQTSKG